VTNQTRFPYLLEDMVVVLMRCMSDPPRLKADHVSFLKKDEDKLAAKLISIPDHISAIFPLSGKDRLAEAVRFLFNLRLATKAGMSSKNMNLVISELGHKWLNSPTDKKLELIIVGLCEARAKGDLAYINTFKFASAPIPLMVKRSVYNPDQDLVDAYSSLEPAAFYTLDEFLTHQVKQNNPLVNVMKESGRASITIGHDHFIRSDAELEVIWADYLKAFAVNRLFALGCISFGYTGGGAIAVSLSSAGQFMIGQCSEFSYAAGGSDKVAIVQPDFDIIFLAPSPAIESKFTPFAERIASGIGVLFKLTRKSVMHAASVEMGPDGVISILNEHSMQPIPENVEKEIRGWFGQCKYVEARETYLVKCPDNATLMRVLEVAGTEVSVVSDVVLELRDVKRKLPFLKLLRENGIFLA